MALHSVSKIFWLMRKLIRNDEGSWKMPGELATRQPWKPLAFSKTATGKAGLNLAHFTKVWQTWRITCIFFYPCEKLVHSFRLMLGNSGAGIQKIVAWMWNPQSWCLETKIQPQDSVIDLKWGTVLKCPETQRLGAGIDNVDSRSRGCPVLLSVGWFVCVNAGDVWSANAHSDDD